MSGAVKRHDGFAGASGAGDAGWLTVVALHPLPLLGVQEDRPLLPGKIKSALQLLHILHNTESALSVGMIEGICDRPRRLHYARFAAGGEFEECLGCLTRESIRQ